MSIGHNINLSLDACTHFVCINSIILFIFFFAKHKYDTNLDIDIKHAQYFTITIQTVFLNRTRYQITFIIIIIGFALA